jgi:hypothetical protein
VDPFIEPLAGARNETTAVLVSRHGPVSGRGWSASYQVIWFAGGEVFESMRMMGEWFPWERRRCHNVRRLARHLGMTLEWASPHGETGQIRMNDVASVKAVVDARAANMGKPPFDSPLRRKRYTPDGTGLREITAEEWAAHEWMNVTSVGDPGDGHVFVGRKRG